MAFDSVLFVCVGQKDYINCVILSDGSYRRSLLGVKIANGHWNHRVSVSQIIKYWKYREKGKCESILLPFCKVCFIVW